MVQDDEKLVIYRGTPGEPKGQIWAANVGQSTTQPVQPAPQPQPEPQPTPQSGANVAPDQCKGKVTNLLVHELGDVNAVLSFRGDWIRICNLDGKLGRTEAVCRSWLALLMEAYQTGDDVVIAFPGAPVNCTTIPTYENAPKVGYIRTQRQ